MYLVEIKYDIGQPVYLRTDPNQYLRIVTRISLNCNGITYELGCGSESSWHYEFEIQKERGIEL